MDDHFFAIDFGFLKSQKEIFEDLHKL